MSSNNEPHRARKRPRVKRAPANSTTNRPAVANASSHSHQSTGIAPTELINPAPMSFEARIGLALQGSNWQELQNSGKSTVAIPDDVLDDEALIDEALDDEAMIPEDDADKPREMTAKQLKKKALFERTIARDTGDVLQTIEPDSIVPVQQDVKWDQDPELICSYNWQASVDETNTIFGTLVCT
jgi:Ca2+-dependent lipid-binding protein